LPLGAAGGAPAEEPGATAGGRNPPPPVASAERDASGGGEDGGRAAAPTIATLRQGDEALAAGAIPLLPVHGPAADEQRPGAPVRQPSLPRASRERPQGGVTELGGDGLGEGRGRIGNAAASGRGPGVANRVCGGLAGDAGEVEPTTASPAAAA